MDWLVADFGHLELLLYLVVVSSIPQVTVHFVCRWFSQWAVCHVFSVDHSLKNAHG
jgi:hypothetical protein